MQSIVIISGFEVGTGIVIQQELCGFESVLLYSVVQGGLILDICGINVCSVLEEEGAELYALHGIYQTRAAVVIRL